MYRPALEIARQGGLGIVPHAGESAGPESVREVLTLDPARIRHGVRASEDRDLMDEIADRRIVLDVCPTSNVRTSTVASIAAHPLPVLVAAGVICSIGTDDPAMFDTDLTHEFDIAASFGLTTCVAYAAGIAGALCDEGIKKRLATIANRPGRGDATATRPSHRGPDR